VARREQERESPADAEADDADRARAAALGSKPSPHGLHIIERPTPPGPQIPADGPQAGDPSNPEEQVGRDPQVPLAGQSA
jgi:hypothetical protein